RFGIASSQNARQDALGRLRDLRTQRRSRHSLRSQESLAADRACRVIAEKSRHRAVHTRSRPAISRAAQVFSYFVVLSFVPHPIPLSFASYVHHRKILSGYSAAAASHCGKAVRLLLAAACWRIFGSAFSGALPPVPGHASRERSRTRSAGDLLSLGDSGYPPT